MPLIILWDIDHTVTEDRTDRLIMRDMFRLHTVAEPEWSVIKSALAEAGREHLGDLRRRGTFLPGARAR